MGRGKRRRAERAKAAASAEAEAKAKAEARVRLLRRALRSLLISVVVVPVLGLFVVRSLAAALPGPAVAVMQMKPILGAGCTLHVVTVVTSGEVDDVYLDAQFPNLIQSHIVGLPATQVTSTSGQRGAGTLTPAVPPPASGPCGISVPPNFSRTGFRTESLDHRLTAHASKPAPDSFIYVLVGTEDGKSTVKPPPPFYMKGYYEYVKLGQTVRKPLDTSCCDDRRRSEPERAPSLFPLGGT